MGDPKDLDCPLCNGIQEVQEAVLPAATSCRTAALCRITSAPTVPMRKWNMSSKGWSPAFWRSSASTFFTARTVVGTGG